jgi:hypothetical protein
MRSFAVAQDDNKKKRMLKSGNTPASFFFQGLFVDHYEVWKLIDEAVGNDEVLRNRKVKELLPAGMIKSTSPVPPDEPAAKDVGKFVSDEGALVVPPDFKRI